MMVLIVSVTLILGGLYQLNTAFKSWANNYFGDYLSCLLETGELPSMGGPPDNNGICNQLFKPFTLAEGRPHANPITATGGGETGGGRGGEGRRNQGGGGGGGGQFSGGGGRFGAGRRGSPGMGDKSRRAAKRGGSATGSTSASDYGGGYSYTQRPQRFQNRSQLDTKFAFQEEKEPRQQRRMASTTKKGDGDNTRKNSIRLKPSVVKTKKSTEADTGFTIGSFLKILIIAAIVIALFMFLGGQALSISKSMD
jgi:hypothetical protein